MKHVSPVSGAVLVLVMALCSSLSLQPLRFSASARSFSSTAKQAPQTIRWTLTNSRVDARAFSMASIGGDIFAGTEGGVFRSSDRGATWQLQNNRAEPNMPKLKNFPLALSPVGLLTRAIDNNNTGGVYLSENRGQSWRRTLESILPSAFGVNGLTLFTQLVPVVAQANGNYPIYRSLDGGASWANITNGKFSARSWAFQNGIWYAGTDWPGGIQRSLDNGATWESFGGGIAPKAVPKMAVTPVGILAYFADRVANSEPDVYSPKGVYLTTNGFQSYTLIESLPVGNRVRDFAVSGSTVFVAIDGRGVYYSNDGGVNFVPAIDGLTNYEVKALTISEGRVYVAASSVGENKSDVFVATIPTNCTYAIAPSSQSFSASGGNGSVSVTTSANCQWTATSNVNWISLSSGATGTGNGSVNFTVAANPSLDARSGTLTIAEQTFTVTQAGATPNPVPNLTALSPATVLVGSSNFALTVTGANFVSGAVVRWNDAERPTSFVSSTVLTAQIPASDVANVGTASVRVVNPAPGGGASNALSLTINSCSYVVQVPTLSFAAAGGTGTASVTTSAACGWTATSSASWLSLNSASSTGSGSLSFSVAANDGPTRSGTLTIAGQTFTITQNSGCSFSLNPTSQSFAAAGGSGSVSVSAGAGCTWTAASNDAWLTLSSSNSGSGNGSVSYSVSANSSTNARSGSLTIAGLAFTVNQGGLAPNPVPVIANLTPSSITAGSPGFTLSINGTDFVPGSVARWNGEDRATTFVSATLLRTNLTASDLAQPRGVNVQVFNPAPGGGLSLPSTFSVLSACPSVAGLTPLTGAPGTVVTITGANFAGVSSVRFSGNVAASIVSATDTQLVVTVPSGAQSGPVTLSKAGCGDVTTPVFNVPASFTVAGKVTYGLGSDSTSVASVELTAANRNDGSRVGRVTDAQGNYVLDGLTTGFYQVSLQKTGEANGLSAFDAAQIWRAVQSGTALSGLAGKAADVDQSGGAPTETDVRMLLRYLVGASNTGRAGQWIFDPTGREYGSQFGSQFNQDYRAVLLGEVTGNWQAGTAGALAITGLAPFTGTASGAAGPDGSAGALWQVSGTNFQPGLTLVLQLPAGAEWRVASTQLRELTPASFQVPLRLALPGLWTLTVINPDGQESPPFSLQWPLPH